VHRGAAEHHGLRTSDAFAEAHASRDRSA
jgi:hypothetical protein